MRLLRNPTSLYTTERICKMKYTEKLIEYARTVSPGLFRLSIYEDGVITNERYAPSSNNNDAYSVAKVFTVTAIGFLVDDKKMSVSDRIVDIFKDEMPEGYDPKWELVTVDMVMRHRWGISSGFLDIDGENMTEFDKKYGSSTDYLANVLSHRLELTPGVEDRYSDAAYYLLSRVVAKIAGADIYEFLRERLFNALHFEELAWSKCPMGYSMGATGLYSRTQDLVKLGRLYLENGVFEGKQIISAEWCNTVFERGYELSPCGNGLYGKAGMFGQQLLVDKARKLVIAWQGFDTTGFSRQLFDFVKTM